MGTRIAALNGVTIAYVMGLVNAVLALVISFGLNLSQTQQGSIVSVVNALLVLVAHASYSQAKRTKPVIPAPPVDESHPTEGP